MAWQVFKIGNESLGITSFATEIGTS